MAPPRPPEPGTPAYVATADQYGAAQRDATRQAAALLRAGARLVAPTGPWASRMLGSVRAVGRSGLCPHLDARYRPDSPVPLYATMPGTLRCYECAATGLDSHPACAMCGSRRPDPLAPQLHLAQRGIVIAYAPLCFPCSHREHRPEGP